MCKCDKCGHEPLPPRMRAIRELMRATKNQRIGQAIVNAMCTERRDIFYVTDADLADALEKLNAHE